MSEAVPVLKGAPPPLPAHPSDALPAGARLAEFEVRRVLGAGGFGIVYLAWDHALEREVALKEYLPITLAGRSPSGRVTIRAASHEETFALGLRSFVNEARLLARFDHPSLVKVYRFWEDNGTAYMAMPMYHGRTLRQVRQAMAAGSPGEAWCRALIDPMLGALERMHREDVYHRDIAPDNILLTDENHAVLLDFGAARRVIGDRTHALTAILKPHFAPIEQYADVSSMRQGPWTDLYGLGATLYYLLTGQPPLPAAARALHDELPPLVRLQPSGCSPHFLQAIDWAMAVRPQERPQSVVIWRDVIEGRMEVPSAFCRDKTLPGVTTRDVLRASTTDFDPTQPAPPLTPPAPTPAASATPGHVSAETAVWRGITLPAIEAMPLPMPPATSAVLADADAAGTAEPAAAAPAAATHRGRWRWIGAGATALALMASFAAVVHAPRSSRGAADVAVAPSAAALQPTATPSLPVPGRADKPAALQPAKAAVASASQTVADAADTPPDATTAAAEEAPANNATPARRTGPAAAHVARNEKRPSRAVHLARQSVEERCAGRNFFSRLVCVKHTCDNDPQARSDATCVRMRRQEEDRRERAYNH